jgi:hypothetical protein
MAILDLKTNLKSLKYESGNEPFVTKDINNPPSNSGIASQITRRADDVVRVTKAILPTNSRFLQNQALLQQIDLSQKIDGIKTAQGKTTAGAIIQQVKNTVVGTAKIAASTIAQTAAAGTGLHIVQGFETRTKKAYGNEAMANGVVNFPGYNPITFLSGSGENKDYGKSNQPYNIKNAYNVTDQDSGNSTYTSLIIKENEGIINLVPAQLTQELINFNNPNSRLNKPSPLKVQINFRDTAKNSFSVDPDTGKPVLTTPLDLPIRDFRQGRSDVISFDYNAPTINKELRVGLGKKGYWKKPVDYTQTRAEAIDRLNATDISFNQLNGVGVGGNSVRDLIKFRFEVLTPGQSPRFLYFRALLTSFDDNYTGNWGSTNYIGRGDAVRIYEGFSREVSVGFKIVATTRDEMKPLYKKMVYLASTTAPSYGEGGNFMKGTLVRLTVGSYLYEVPGVINSVKYTWQENYPWEIALQNPESGIDDDMQELPHIMDCSVSFGVIHDFTPQTGLYHYITSPTLAGGASPFFLSGAQS